MPNGISNFLTTTFFHNFLYHIGFKCSQKTTDAIVMRPIRWRTSRWSNLPFFFSILYICLHISFLNVLVFMKSILTCICLTNYGFYILFPPRYIEDPSSEVRKKFLYIYEISFEILEIGQFGLPILKLIFALLQAPTKLSFYIVFF